MSPKPSLLTCPYCETPLYEQKTDFRCARNHTFPLSQEGYVNLLGQTRAVDTAPMLTARRRLLDTGAYLPIAQALANNLIHYLPSTMAVLPSRPTMSSGIIDAGCGEGHYLGHIQKILEEISLPIPLACYGFDSSKAAVKLAARRYHSATFFVSNIKQLWNIAPATSCAILNVFAPRNFVESARILQPRGMILTIIPTQKHLHELRNHYHLLQIESQKEARVYKQANSQFNLSHTEVIEYQ